MNTSKLSLDPRVVASSNSNGKENQSLKEYYESIRERSKPYINAMKMFRMEIGADGNEAGTAMLAIILSDILDELKTQTQILSVIPQGTISAILPPKPLAPVAPVTPVDPVAPVSPVNPDADVDTSKNQLDIEDVPAPVEKPSLPSLMDHLKKILPKKHIERLKEEERDEREMAIVAKCFEGAEIRPKSALVEAFRDAGYTVDYDKDLKDKYVVNVRKNECRLKK